jgi:hypothetical protein
MDSPQEQSCHSLTLINVSSAQNKNKLRHNLQSTSLYSVYGDNFYGLYYGAIHRTLEAHNSLACITDADQIL